mgnify:CR=1 FL=1
MQFETWFNTPINRETYISLAAHEITHAITDSHFKINKPNVHAREYLAYVTLFATMPSELRKRMLNAMPGSTPEDDARLSLMVYLMDPMFFGAKSYRHFMSLNHAAQVSFWKPSWRATCSPTEPFAPATAHRGSVALWETQKTEIAAVFCLHHFLHVQAPVSTRLCHGWKSVMQPFGATLRQSHLVNQKLQAGSGNAQADAIPIAHQA